MTLPSYSDQQRDPGRNNQGVGDHHEGLRSRGGPGRLQFVAYFLEATPTSSRSLLPEPPLPGAQMAGRKGSPRNRIKSDANFCSHYNFCGNGSGTMFGRVVEVEVRTCLPTRYSGNGCGGARLVFTTRGSGREPPTHPPLERWVIDPTKKRGWGR